MFGTAVEGFEDEHVEGSLHEVAGFSRVSHKAFREECHSMDGGSRGRLGAKMTPRNYGRRFGKDRRLRARAISSVSLAVHVLSFAELPSGPHSLRPPCKGSVPGLISKTSLFRLRTGPGLW